MRHFVNTLAAAALTVTAAQAAPLVIEADTTLAADHAGPIVVAADGVTLDCGEHRVEGDGSDAIGIHVQGHDVTLLNCSVDRFTESGIAARDVDRLTLRDVGASRTGVGVHIAGGAGHVVERAYVTTSRHALWADDIRDSALRAVTADTMSDHGIVLFRAVDSELSDSLVLRAGGRGVLLWQGFRTTLRDLDVNEAADRGIYVGATAATRIEGCLIRWSGHNGIGLHRTTLATAVGNQSVGNGKRGINVSQSTTATLEGNATDGNAEVGFGVWQSAMVEGSGNTSVDEAPLKVEGELQPDLGELGAAE